MTKKTNEIIFTSVGQNVIATIEGAKFTKKIADKDEREAFKAELAAYNIKNSAAKLKAIKAKFVVDKQEVSNTVQKKIKEVKEVKELTLADLEAKSSLNQKEKALYKKLLLAETNAPKATTAPPSYQRHGER